MKLSTLSAALAGLLLGAAGLAYYTQHQERAVQPVPASNAPDMTALPLNGSSSGELSSQSYLNLVNGVRSQAYTLHSTTDQIIRLSVQGPLNAQLTVLQKGRLIAQSHCAQCPEREGELTLGFKALPDTDYTVVVSGVDERAYGPFDLSSEVLKSYAGQVLQADTQFSDWGLGKERRYRLNIDTAGLYQIDMHAQQPQMDPYLALKDRRNKELAADDDGGENLDAKIRTYLSPGEYILEATSALGASQLQGGYEIHFQAVPLPEDMSLTQQSVLELDGITRNGVLDQSGIDLLIELAEPTIVDLTLEATGFMPDWSLDGGNQGVSGQNTQRIRTSLEAGTHTLRILGQSQQAQGLFSVTAKTMPPGSPVSGGTLSLGQTHSAQLLAGTRRDVYRLSIPQSGEYKILMESPRFDTYLELYQGQSLIAEDDDSAGDMNSLLTLNLSAGEYEIHAISLGSSDRDMEYEIGVYRQ